MTTAPASNDSARIFAFVLLGSAVLILVGTFNHSWLSAKGGEAGIGPLGVEMCRGGMCKSVGWGKVGSDISLFGTLSVIGGIAAALVAGAFGGAFVAGKGDKLPSLKVANVVLGLAAFATTFFLFRMISEGGKGLSISWGAFPAIGGILVSGAMLRKLAPSLKPPTPAYPLPPTQPTNPPPPPLPPTMPMPPQS